MGNRPRSKVIQQLRRAVLLQHGAGLTDGQLLECFLTHRDDAAFAALVRRHGPMVWGVCRRVLHNHHDAEDAFQATFLVLVRKAASVEPKEMVANWLYGVAHQTALKARATAARRKGREKQVVEMPEPAVEAKDVWQDLQPLLDQQLSRLPHKYRAPIVLCDLEGKTRKEAARQLGWPEGSVAGRLSTARKLLAKRLARYGLPVSSGALAAVLSHNAGSACGPPSVLSSTIKAASLFAAGQAATAGLISVQVAALTEGVLKTMLLTKLKAMSMVLLAAAALTGAAGMIYETQAGEQAQTKKQRTEKKPPAEKPDKERLQGTWKIVSAVDGGEKDESEVGAECTFKDSTIKLMPQAKENTGAFTSYLRFRLDEMTNPKLIDLVEGKAEDLFDTAKFDKRLEDANERKEGIYSIAGDSLKICLSRKKGERPITFESKQGSDYILIVLKREKGEKDAQPKNRPGPPPASVQNEKGLLLPIGPFPVLMLAQMDKTGMITFRRAENTFQWDDNLGGQRFVSQYLRSDTIDARIVRAFDTKGREIDWKILPQLLRTEIPVLVAVDEKEVDPLHLRLIKDGTLILVGSPPPFVRRGPPWPAVRAKEP